MSVMKYNVKDTKRAPEGEHFGVRLCVYRIYTHKERLAMISPIRGQTYTKPVETCKIDVGQDLSHGNPSAQPWSTLTVSSPEISVYLY